MKLLRYGNRGEEKPGLLDAGGVIRDLSPLIDDITPKWLSRERLAWLSALDPAALPAIEGQPRLGVPVSGARQFIGIGLNYRRHAIEAGLDIPKEPVVFNKAITCLNGPCDDVVIPPDSSETDWEVELGVVMGTEARRVSENDALNYVAGYAIVNDVSERFWQFKRNGQWVKGKSFDTFGPVGPWLVTANEIGDPQHLELKLAVNGEVRQHSNTADMIFSVATLIAHLSQFMTLLPGDIIATGTPSGVGLGMKPPKYLKRGDAMTLTVDGLGTQTQRVV
ncbi:MAG: FAA hydrolase family protein [Candidimonas sp.]|nr:MAG: FAA hydrolase family protein [Candidimonas sp.]